MMRSNEFVLIVHWAIKPLVCETFEQFEGIMWIAKERYL